MVDGWSLTIKRWLVLVFLAGFVLAAPGGAVAQDDRPPRVADRAAPERAVVTRPEAPEAVSSRIIIEADADTYIASERPYQNFGRSGLFLGYNLNGDVFGAERIFLHFDVEAYLPAGAVIDDAQMVLYLAYANPAGDAPMATYVRRIDEPWGEYTLTWNQEPEWGPIYDKFTDVGATPDTGYAWDLTDLVQQWVDGSQTNYGVELFGDERVQQRERSFYARETGTALYPQLVVDYRLISDDEPPEITVDALPPYEDRDFTVSWDGTDPGEAEIAYYDVQARVDGGAWQDWRMGVTVQQAEFVGENGRTYDFRARGVDEAGNVEAFGGAEATTTVDTLPPDTTVNPLPAILSVTSFPVSWTGSDAESGIAAYDVFYRVNGGPWTAWLLSTTSISATFDAATDAYPEVDAVYAFEARAVDVAGNVEPLAYEPEASTIVDASAPFVLPEVWLPLVMSGGGSQ